MLYVLIKTGGSRSVYLVFMYLFIYLFIYLFRGKAREFQGMVEKRHKRERQETLRVTNIRLTSLPQLNTALKRSPS